MSAVGADSDAYLRRLSNQAERNVRGVGEREGEGEGRGRG